MGVTNSVRESSKVRYSSRFKIASAVLAMGISLCLPRISRATDTVTIANPVTAPATVNLSSGATDWAHWANPGDPGAGVVAPTFDHPTSTNFSNVSGVDGSLTGYDATSGPPDFTWSGGTPDSTGSSHSWNYNPNSIAGAGETFTFLVPTGHSLLNVYAEDYAGTALAPLPVQLQATLTSGANATNATSLPTFYDASINQQGDYVVNVQNNTGSSETLTVTFTQTAVQNGSGFPSNTGLYGVSDVTVVPEPASAMAVLGGMSFFGLRRRRRQNHA
jgi:hypothetical protein